jgi:high-affinity Fe2+/Pb2+ permease
MNSPQNQLLELYGVWYKPWWHSAWLYGCLASLVVLVISYYLILFLKRKKKLSPSQEALQQLYRLTLVNYTTDRSLHEAYFALTMIMKKYLIATYAIPLQDKADIEIVAELHGIIPENMIYLLEEFFNRSFHIKFAYDVASVTMLKQDIEMLRACIIELSKEKAK